MASIIELAFALLCLAVAGHLIIRLFDGHRENSRKDK